MIDNDKHGIMAKKSHTQKTAGTSFGITSLVLQEAAQSFLKNNGFEMSAALSSYGFFSLIPLLFFIMYLLGNYVVSSQTALTGVQGLMTHMFPQLSPDIMNEVHFLTRQKGTWGIFSLLMLLVSVIPFMDTLRTAFRGILKTGRTISFVRSQLQNLIAILIALVLLALMVVGEIFYSSFTTSLSGRSAFVVGIMDLVASFVIVIALVLAFYRTLMPARIGTGYLLVASLITATLLISIGTFFSRFLIPNPDYGLAFGSLKTIGIIIAWVYCSFLAILFGAEIMVTMNMKDALLLKKLLRSGWGRRQPSRELLKKFVKTYETGEAVFREGEKGDTMLYILSGSVTVNKKDRIIRQLGKGQYFGEMAMLLDSQRTATVVAADGPLEVVAISRYNLEIILRHDPEIVMSILKEMASRLKLTSEGVV